jgi:hypothetical protein
MKRFLISYSALMVASVFSVAGPNDAVHADSIGCPGLRDTIILLIRHAEKPDDGQGLSAEGQERAGKYVKYFRDYTVDGRGLKLDHLFATADSKQSQRPRLTLEPLGKALGLDVDARFPTKNPAQFVGELRSREHGKALLVCWHHKEIPEILRGLGADPAVLLPKGEWPDEVFGWVLELHFDGNGQLNRDKTRRVNEHLRPDDRD